MISEPNTPEQGIDNAPPQADDTAPDWDFYDPDEEQDTVETPKEEATDDGTEPADEADSTEGEPEPVAEIVAAHEAVVEMADGSKVKVADLIQGQLRQEDYTRKTQEVANTRKALTAEVERIESITTALVSHLEKLVPPEPSHALALRDPNRYTQQMAVHKAALAQLNDLIEIGQKPKEIKETVSAQERTEKERAENAALVNRFPTLANPQERQKFFTEAVNAAAEVGLSLDDLQGITDHRVFAALHYAAKGLKAEKAMKVAQEKVQKAPPVAPQKPVGPAKGNADAMRKLSRSGSIKDALRVDWD